MHKHHHPDLMIKELHNLLKEPDQTDSEIGVKAVRFDLQVMLT